MIVPSAAIVLSSNTTFAISDFTVDVLIILKIAL